MSALVIKHWKADRAVDAQGNYVSITGRASGIIAWLLSLAKIDPVTRIAVSRDRIEFSSASMAGTELRLVPLQSVCSTYYGYHKPWKAAVSLFSTFCLLGIGSAGAVAGDQGANISGGFMALLVMGLVGLVVALIYYFFNRTLTLGFIETSGVANGIKFKRSMIENIDVNEEQAKQVCLLIQSLIEDKERRVGQRAA